MAFTDLAAETHLAVGLLAGTRCKKRFLDMFSSWHFSVWCLLTSSNKKIAWILKAFVTTPEPASQHRRDCDKRETRPRSQRHSILPLTAETEEDKWETQPRSQRHSIAETARHRETAQHLPSRHRETSGRHSQRHSIWNLTAEIGRETQHLASDRRSWQTQGAQATRPGANVAASQRLRDAGRQAGDTTPEPASQHLASDRRDWETQGDKQETETQGDKRETRPWSHRYSIWHLTGETGRQEDKWKTGPRNRRHTFPFAIPQVRTPMLRCLGKIIIGG